MSETLDQIFVNAKALLVGFFPAAWHSMVAAVISVAAILAVFPGLFALTTIIERKGLGRIQNRYGPNRVGPLGFFQPIADGLKTMTKEDIVPRDADKVIHFLAPLMLVIPAFLALAVIPVGRNMAAASLDAGLLYFFAVGSATELAIFMAGWSSRNKYALLGAMRGVAQMISYEIPLILSAIPVIMITGSLSPELIVLAQGGFTGPIPHWFVFTPWGLAGFLIFLVSATAESNRSPFDLPEGESEIIAGYYIEYSGFKFALFFLGEYIGLFAVSGMVITLFLGGWQAPFSFLAWVPSYFWFFAKLAGLIALFIWVRGTLPRLRMDQLMNFAWKFLLPLSLLNLFSAAIWAFMPHGFSRWLVGFGLLVIPYVFLGRTLFQKQNIAKRIYRYAE
jgi:NADH-quinone oxidoreductase subunit H